MTSIRIPVGSTTKDKEAFVKEMLRVFPLNSIEKIESTWDRLFKIKTLLIIMNIETCEITHSMKIDSLGDTYWELSANFIQSNKLIQEFKIEEYDSKIQYNIPNMSSTYQNSKPVKIEYNVDDILDDISEFGYDKLSDDKKEFLNKMSTKK